MAHTTRPRENMSLTMLHMDVVCTSGAAQTRQTLCTALLHKLTVAELHHNFQTLTEFEKLINVFD